MSYNKSDLGPKMVNGVEVTRTDAEADALVAYWNANEKTELAVELEMLRKKRNGILSRTDWMANSDVTMTDAWKTYRQALRDLTNGLDTADKVKFLWIYNTGTTDGSTVTADSIYLNFDDSAATNGGKDMFEIPAKTTWYCRVPSTLVGEVHAIAGQANAAGTGSGNVQCVVCAIIDDVA